ncbi:XisH family protein [Chloroflexi bacterium TSY]|nr:XisH family protein [Chloroflexi bacterium TSY]
MAKDKIHDAVKNALINDGWTITKEHLHIEHEELGIFADLVAERGPFLAEKDGRKIIVEIKTFGGRSFMRKPQQAVGQYEIYLDMIALAGLEHDLYIAISGLTYSAYFTRKATSQIVQRRQLKLLVVNIEREEIIKWLE